jgi:hypothetical protein
MSTEDICESSKFITPTTLAIRPLLQKSHVFATHNMARRAAVRRVRELAKTRVQPQSAPSLPTGHRAGRDDRAHCRGSQTRQPAQSPGGHSWACWSIRQDSVLIDLVNFHYVDYDEQSQVLAASPATLSQDVCAYLATKGRWIPVGHCGTVGIGGFILQGGMGWNARVREAPGLFPSWERRQ